MKEEREFFKIVTDEGKEVVCEKLVTFESEETGKNYMIYTDNTKDEDGKTRVYACTYDPEKDEQTTHPIETEEEWRTIEVVLEQIMEEVENGQD